MHCIKLIKQHIDIPAGDQTEEFITCVILASIELLYGKSNDSTALINIALGMARQMAEHGDIRTSSQVSKFACFKYDFGDSQETLPLPIINNVLILPEINLNGVIDRIKQSIPKMVDLKDVYIAYFMLQLNIRDIIHSLESARNTPAVEEAIDAIGAIIKSSLVHASVPSDPIEIAVDYFSLARNLINKGNVTLTRIALKNAYNALNEPDLIRKLTFRQRKRLTTLRSELKVISDVVGRHG